MTNGYGNSSPYTKWSEIHNDIRKAEHGFSKTFCKVQHRGPFSFAKHSQCNSENDTENNYGKYIAVVYRLHDILRKYMQNKILPALWFGFRKVLVKAGRQ